MTKESAVPTAPVRSWRLRAFLSFVIAGSALFVVGCSGGAPEQQSEQPGRPGGRKPPAQVVAPEPRGGVEAPARDVAAAVRAGDCERLKALNFSGLKNLNDARCEHLLGQLKGFRVEDSEEYGTGAVVEFSTARSAGTMVFVAGGDGTFRWTQRVPRERNSEVVGTRAPRGNRLDSVASSAVESYREGRCRELEAAARGIVRDPMQPRQFCENRESLRGKLVEDPSARPRRLGANSRVAFYSLLVKPNGPYDTLVLLQEGRRAAFLGDYAVPAARGK